VTLAAEITEITAGGKSSGVRYVALRTPSAASRP
jgi:hypothetical protein